MHTELDTMHNEIGTMNHKIDKVYNLLDAAAKQREIDNHERAALSAQVDRHEIWVQQIAKGSTLSYAIRNSRSRKRRLE